MSKSRAKATVNITLEVPCSSVWGHDCPYEQIIRQAQQDAKDSILKLFRTAGGDHGFKVVSMDRVNVRLEEDL